MTDFSIILVTVSLATTELDKGVLLLRPVRFTPLTLLLLLAVLYRSPLLVADTMLAATVVQGAGRGVDGVYDGMMRFGMPVALVLLLLALEFNGVFCSWESGVAAFAGVRDGVTGVGVHLGI